ncbi:1,4-alpha-glucan branching protein GlgB [Alteromonadaceae bacterium BrNp21-10]|nr:1,4-alpha-glucan branching protein GlgB [Alteromonadaceae bacterium BrNp21-10]
MTSTKTIFADSAQRALLNGEYVDAFSILGMHHQATGKGLMIRAYLPGAQQVDVISLVDNKKVVSLAPVGEQGFFAAKLGRRTLRFAYKLKVTYPLVVEEVIDPYQFGSLLQADDLYLFAEGKQQQAYNFQGANWKQAGDISGVHFCVWAPNARRVSVIGDFNHWNRNQHIMRLHPASGMWDIFIPNCTDPQHYKFDIVSQSGGHIQKSDPYAKSMQCAPDNASVIPSKTIYEWQDSGWMTQRPKQQWHAQPMSTYEVHLASWRRKGDEGKDYFDYQDLINELIPYVKEMGFTHLQLMPISEYPFDGSWGYQPVGLFAPTYRLGDGAGLKAFIDACHQHDIAVLLDWVPAHFPKDPHGLARFDGTCLYEHADPRKGEHPDWNTLIYNYGRSEVRSFLLSNACYWIKEFHFDGLRLDAVSSMLYLDYSREQGEWQPNEYGGRENLQAISFLQELNQRLYADFPGIMMVAEESTSWPGVTGRVDQNGLGFGFKWNMGWMNDSLSYLKRDPIYRSHHHHEMTFSMVYAYTEQFILSLSHDEVVHGKGSLVNKIPGDDWQKFSTLRAYLGYMWGHPGKKLLFMGNEFAQRNEWSHDRSLDWHLLQYAPHQGIQQWIKDLNQLYVSYPAMHQCDHQAQGFGWLDCENANDSIFAYVRYAEDASDHLIFIVNMTPTARSGYQVGVPLLTEYVECLNSDSDFYQGSNVGNLGPLAAIAGDFRGMPASLTLTIPPLACIVLKPNSAPQALSA